MENNWKNIKLSEIGKIITGKTPSTKEKENFGGKIPFLTPSDDMDSRYVLKTIRYLTDVGVNKLSNKIVPKNSICTSCIGSQLGKVTITTEDTVSNQQINTIIPNKNYNYMFVYYLMLLVGKRLNYISKTSTAVPIINKNDFSEMVVEVPNKDIQYRISVILDSIDSKIEVNNKIIANLEEQAQAIFKSWFVDFEPFQDGNFVESELGMIPEGWEVKNIKSLMEFETGSEPGAKNYSINKNMRIPFYRVGEMLSETNIFVKKKLLKDRVTSKEDVLVSFDGTVGRVVTGLVGGYSSGIKKITPKVETISSNLIYVLFKSKLIQDIINQNATGTTILHASKSIDYMYIPYNDEIYSNFSLVIDPLINIIRVLKEENKKLAEIRDALLPKLMSGEIDVSNIKIKGEEVKNEWNLFRRWFWKNFYKIYWGLRLPLPPSPRNCKR